MRALAVVAVLVGCKDPVPVMPDAAPLPDVPVVPDFFGEPCAPPSTTALVSLCRTEPDRRGYCTPAGICRPFCGYYENGQTFELCRAYGGVEVRVGANDRYPGTCYCEPR